jgi:hypothetical protein
VHALGFKNPFLPETFFIFTKILPDCTPPFFVHFHTDALATGTEATAGPNRGNYLISQSKRNSDILHYLKATHLAESQPL